MMYQVIKKLNFNELKIEKIIQCLRFIKYRTAFFIIILLVSIDYFLVIIPGKEQYVIFKDQETILRENFKKKQRVVTHIKNYRKQVETLNNKLNNLLKLLPNKNEISSLSEEIFKLAKNSGLTIHFFAPMTEIKHEFYIESPIKVTLVGDYNQLALFLSKVTHLPYLITFGDFREKLFLDNKKIELSNLLLMKIAIKVYRLKTL